MSDFLRLLLGLSISGSLLALLLVLLRRVLGAKLPSAFWYGAWLLVLLRFLLPLPGLLPDLTAEHPAPLPAPALTELSADTALRPYNANTLRPSPARPQTPGDALAADEAALPAVTQARVETGGLTLADIRQAVRSPRFLFSLWLSGFLVSAAWQLSGYLRFRRELEATLRPARSADRALFAQLSGQPRPRLCRSRAVTTPMLVGVFRPLIVLPEGDYSETVLRGILAHELTHQRRGDVAVKWLAVFAGLLHWFNPVTRLFRRELDRACELACDERLLRGMDAGEQRLYGDMLLTLAANRRLPRAVVATSFAVEKRNLKERLVQIMNYRKRSRAALVLALAMILLLSACGAAVGPQMLRRSQVLGAAVSETPPTPEPRETLDPAAFAASPFSENAEVSVSTVDELLANLGPNTTVTLEPGVYDLSAAADYGRSHDSGYYTWNDCYDGYELVIRRADNLIIQGLPDSETVLSAVPRYAEVLRFENCRNLLLSTVTVGHTQEPGQCAGGVVEFDSCVNARVLGCSLYGCGVLGVTAINCDTVHVESSAIYECSSGAVWAQATRDFRLESCDIYSCPGKSDWDAYTLFSVQTSTGFAVVNSRVRDNRAARLLNATSSDEIYFLGTEITGNRFETLFESNLIAPVVEGCSFTGNAVSGQALTGIDALKARDGSELSASALRDMQLVPQVYEGPKLREVEAVTGIPVQDGMEYHVTTVDELLSCIGSDTTIYLDAETFNWSEATNYGGYGGQHYYWIDNYDGPSLVISGVENLRLIGQGKDRTTVLAEPRYADVIGFEKCAHVTVANLTAGHTTEPSYCMGDVLGFSGCQDVHIVDCGLFGCGVWGIHAYDCIQGDILRTEIYECSEGAAQLYRTTGFVFTDCSVHDCAGKDWNMAETETAHNYLFLSDCGDIVYNGIPMAEGLTIIEDGNIGGRPWEEQAEAQIYEPEEFLHLYYYNVDVSQGFTLTVGDEVLLDAVPPYYVDGLEFSWGTGDAARLGLSVSESGYSCTLKALKATQGSVTLTLVYGDLALSVPVYIRN